MMTGTPLDLTPFGSLLNFIGLLYWAAMLGAVVLALRLPKSRKVKLSMAAVVGGIFVVPVTVHVIKKEMHRAKVQRELDVAKSRFNILCQSAGEKINRTVENVEGVF